MDKTLRILMLEDNPADAELVQFELEGAEIAFTARIVMTEKDFIQALQEYCPDIILSDYDLPRYTGASALAEAKSRCPDVPFILVSGAVTEDRAIEILTQGAKDYVLKNRLSQRLVPAVRRALAEAEEHRARKQAEKELRKAYRSLEEKVKIRTADLQAEVLARTKMEETQRLNAAVLETVAEGIFLIGLDDNIIKWANRKFEELFGYDHGEVVGMHVDNVNAPTDKTPTENRISIVDVLRRDGEWHGEVKNIKKDGTHFWSYINVSLFDHPEFGKVMVSAHMDITERKQAEKAFLESREQYRELLVNASSIIIRMDHEGAITFFNEYAQKFFGYAQDEVLGKDVRILVPPVESNGKNLIKMADDILGNPDEFDENINENVLKNGERVWVLWRNKAIRDSSGNIIGNIAVGSDITQRKRIDEALAAKHNQLQDIIDNTPAIVYAFDLEERFVMANTALAKLLNSTPEQMIGKRRQEFMPKEDADWHEANDREVIEAGRAQEFEEYSRLKDRSIAWLTTKFPLRDAQGRIYAVAGISTDVTERKLAEEALKQQSARLE
jgi:PAS domain S-box-containing protein